MSRRRRTKEEMMGQGERQDVNVIGFITTPIKDIARTKPILELHGVILMKCQSDDGWYTLVLPQGSTREIVEEKRDIYEISLPDGYIFYYIPPIFHGHEKHYARVPEVLFEYKTIHG